MIGDVLSLIAIGELPRHLRDVRIKTIKLEDSECETGMWCVNLSTDFGRIHVGINKQKRTGAYNSSVMCINLPTRDLEKKCLADVLRTSLEPARQKPQKINRLSLLKTKDEFEELILVSCGATFVPIDFRRLPRHVSKLLRTFGPRKLATSWSIVVGGIA